MKHPTFRGLLRLAAFLLGLALIVAFANTFCIKTDIYAALTMAEVKTRSDIDVAFVGSSIVRDHFNAEMISKEIGKTCFALGIPCGMLQGNIASTRELYRKNSPEWTILVIEPFTVDSAKEGIEGQYDLLPFLSSPLQRRQGGRLVRRSRVHVPRLRRRFVRRVHGDRRHAPAAVPDL